MPKIPLDEWWGAMYVRSMVIRYDGRWENGMENWTIESGPADGASFVRIPEDEAPLDQLTRLAKECEARFMEVKS